MERQDDNPQPNLPPFQMQAIMRETQRIMDAQLEAVQERMDQMETLMREFIRNSRSPRRRRRPPNNDDDDEPLYHEEESDRESYHEPRRNFRRRNDEDNNLNSIKMRIPQFNGRSNPEAYLEWEKKVEFIFDCHNYSENKKVKLAVTEFSDYALTWWDQLVTNRRRNLERPISTWAEMKAVMRKRFIPSHFYRDLHNKLQGLKQGTRSVDDYFKEMEVAMIRANVEEDREATMARFLNGLNRDIQDRVEMYHYVELEDLVHGAMKIEQQLKKGSNSKMSSWKSSAYKKEEKSTPSSKVSKPQPKEATPSKGKESTTSSNRNCDIKYLNVKVGAIMQANAQTSWPW